MTAIPNLPHKQVVWPRKEKASGSQRRNLTGRSETELEENDSVTLIGDEGQKQKLDSLPKPVN